LMGLRESHFNFRDSVEKANPPTARVPNTDAITMVAVIGLVLTMESMMYPFEKSTKACGVEKKRVFAEKHSLTMDEHQRSKEGALRASDRIMPNNTATDPSSWLLGTCP